MSLKTNTLRNEEWRVVEGFPGYSVSDLGRVRGKYGKILKPKTDRYGYLQVALRHEGKQNSRTVHRLVAQAFIPNLSEKPEVNHKNGVKTDNRASNLEWATKEENLRHARELGLFGYKQALKDEAVELIRQGLNCSEAARLLSVSQPTVWRWARSAGMESRCRQREESVKRAAVEAYLSEGVTLQAVADRLQISLSTARRWIKAAKEE